MQLTIRPLAVRCRLVDTWRAGQVFTVNTSVGVRLLRHLLVSYRDIVLGSRMMSALGAWLGSDYDDVGCSAASPGVRDDGGELCLFVNQ